MPPKFAIAALPALLAATPAIGQDSEAEADEGGQPATAEELIANAHALYRAPGTRRPCKPPVGNEIVVCAQDPSRFRARSSLDEAISRGEAPFDGTPNAPDVDGLPRGGVVVARGCFVPPCPPPPAYFIDFDSLPEPLTPEQAARVLRADETAPAD